MTNLTTLLLIGVSTFSFGQNNPNTPSKRMQTENNRSNIQLYNIEYKLVDESIIAMDSTVLNNMNLERFDYVRLKSEDIVFFDKEQNLEVVVFSFDKIRGNQSGLIISK
ncbi:MAG: hypothetical protein ACPGVI_03910 [Crocinitomicaceae bacterium]